MEAQIAYSTLKLVFAEAGPAPTLELGPFDEVRIDAVALRSGRGGEVIANLENQALVRPPGASATGPSSW